MPDSDALATLRQSMQGQLLLPDAAEYDDTRAIWNGMIDRKPAAIALCENVDDVVAAVNFARQQELRLSVRCGGHGVAGKAVCDDGLMIDLAGLNSVTVDVDAKTATVGGGARLGALDAATQPHGLATTAGMVSETGVGGLTLGGGVGYLARRFGLTADNLLAAEMVTADGTQVRASADENSDLFWALRGGGGNFGIVTSFTFQLHEVGPEVLVGQAFYPIEDAAAVLRFYREWTADAPDELAAYVMAVVVPPAEPFPEASQGKTAMGIVSCFSGDADAGREAFAPLEAFGDPIVRFVQPMPYVALQQAFNAGVPDGGRYYWKSHFHRELSDDCIDTFVREVTEVPGPLSMVGFEPLGGQINRVDSSATAFPHRDCQYALGVWCGWVDEANDEAAISWARNVYTAMEPFATGGVYSNYLDHDDSDRANDAFAANLARLQRVKAAYDPHNVFGGNQNITPS